jgi:glycosyltransferase involved in cell wall biosynthesis
VSRIVLVCPSMQFGGAERLVVDLAAQLAAQHLAVAIAAPAGPLDAELAPGVERLVLDETGRSPLGSARNAVRLARFARRFRADVLHGHNVKASTVAAAAARLTGRRPRPAVAATFHGVAHAEYRAAARLLRGADRVACVSADLRDRLVAAGHPPERLDVIPNAVSVAPPRPGDRAALAAELGLDDGPLVAIVGRLVPQKAHEHFLAAMAEVVRAVPEVQGIVVGDGPRRAELEALSAACGLAGRVTFTGVRRDARELIARADVLVFSSHWEGLSIAALEGLAAGTPVVSTDVEGMRELLSGGAGRLVPPGDPEALAGAVVEVLRSPELRAAMGAAGRDLVSRRYAPAAMRDAYLALYRDARARVSGP